MDAYSEYTFNLTIPISEGEILLLPTKKIDDEICLILKQIEIVKDEMQNISDHPSLSLFQLQENYYEDALSFLRLELAKRNNSFPFDISPGSNSPMA